MPTIVVNNEAEWHTLRDSHVGGSEIACLFYRWLCNDGVERVFHIGEQPEDGGTLIECLSPHKTGFRLLQEKRGILRPDDLSEVERVQAGTHLEPALAAWSSEVFKWNIRKVVRYFEHDKVPGWGASLDYELHEKQKSGTPVEFKNVDFLIYRDQWQVVDGEIVMPPLHIVLQLQHQIGATKSADGWIVVCVGGNKLHRFNMPAHAATQARIAEAVTAFWEMVKSDEEPTWIADATTAKELYAYGEESKKPLDLTGDEAALIDIRKLHRWRKHAAFVVQHLDFIEGRLQVRMKRDTRATLPGWKISWPVIERIAKMLPAKWQDELIYRGRFTLTPKGE